MEQEKKEIQIKIKKLEAQLKNWGIDLEQFKAKAGKTKAETKVKLDQEVAALRTKWNGSRKKLDELKKAGGAASGELKKGVENALRELKKAFDNATAKFK